MTPDDFRQEIMQLLRCLGVTENYKGFFPTVYAVQLAIDDPSRLQLITKLIYPTAGRYYGATWKTVERNMRTVVSVAWRYNEWLLSELAGFHLPDKPTNARFLAIMASVFPSSPP